MVNESSGAVDWAPALGVFRPNAVSDAAWDVICRAIATQFGSTKPSFNQSLDTLVAKLQSFGLADGAIAPVSAFSFSLDLIGDFGGVADRHEKGSFGQGWQSIADVGLTFENGFIRVGGLESLAALQSLAPDAVATYTVSRSADRGVSLDGNITTEQAARASEFQLQADGSYTAITSSTANLVRTQSGYELSYPDGSVAAFDASGSFTTWTDPAGNITTASYDADGLLEALDGPQGNSLTLTRNASGLVETATSENGDVITFAYDATGNLSSSTSADGIATFGYNANGLLTTVTAPGDIDANIGYDSLSRLQSINYEQGTQSEAFTYDGLGGITRTDGEGRQSSIELLPGGVIGRTTDGNGDTSSVSFDPSANSTTITAPDGSQTTLVFDDQNRLTTLTDANSATVTFMYQGDSQSPDSFTNANGNARQFTYDAAGRITDAEWADSTSLGFTYDAFGNVTTSVNRRGDGVTYTYNTEGQLLSESDGSSGAVNYTYTAEGRLASATDDRGTTLIDYNTEGQITQITYPDGRSLAYTYNDAGLRSSMTDQSGDVLNYTYDDLGRLTGLNDAGGTIVTYEYDAAGNLAKETNGNGTVSTFTYDNASQLTDIVNAQSDGTVNSFYSYTYDATGQRTRMETHDGDWDYGYDATGQLTSADFVSSNPLISDKSISYEYDAAGNRTRVTEDGVETNYTTNALNQYTQVGNATFTYDDDGNMTSKTEGADVTTYAYDINNRLIQVMEPDGTLHQHEYDAFGNRVATTSGGVRTEYLVDPFGFGNVVSDYAADGTRIADYSHGLGLARRENGAGDLGYYDVDGVGSVGTVTGTTGSISNKYAYTPFGKELYEVEAIANRYEFNGLLGVSEDSDDTLNMRARNYDPETGRFLTEDPAWLSGDPGNLYRFALNYPTALLDPEGDEPITIIIIGGVVLSAVGISFRCYCSGD